MKQLKNGNLILFSITEPYRNNLKLRFLIKSSYYIVPSPYTALVIHISVITFTETTMAAAETQEMWRFCANWLLQLEVIPKNHRVMTSDATFQDLAYTLRDGVLLCHIASTIDENSISPRSINHRPQMAQFLCLQNIRLFLTACKVGHTIFDLFMSCWYHQFRYFTC